MENINKKYLLYFLKVVVSITIFCFALSYINFYEFKKSIMTVGYLTFFFATALNIFSCLFLALRWHFFTRKIFKKNKFLFLNVSIYLKSIFYSSFTPSFIGSDGYKYLTYVRSESQIKILSIIFVERILSLAIFLLIILSLFVFFDFGMMVLPIFWSSKIYLLKFIFLFFLILFIFFNKSILKYFNFLFSDLDRKNITIFSFGTVISILLWIFSFQVIAYSINYHMPFPEIIFCALITELMRMLPLSVQGIGIREGFFAFLAHQLGFDFSQSFVIGLVSYLSLSLSLVLCFPLGIFIGKALKNNLYDI